MRGFLALALAAGALGLGAPPAAAVILPPTAVAPPGGGVVELGGTAMAPDGTGGVVYTKEVAGVPHVFVSRYTGSGWSAPIRVDRDRSFAAAQPRIAAGTDGRLLVVWVTPVATVGGVVRDGLFSAALGPGAEEFGPPLLIDRDVGEGAGLDPALAGTEPGRAIVVYRVVTSTFGTGGGGSGGPFVQLRPGDVIAQIRAARLVGDRWSHVGPLNHDPAASMRPLSEANAPQVGIGAGGDAVVAWQEPDQSGVARVWVRRIFGTTPGPAFEASPADIEGRPVSADAGAFSLAVTAYDGAWVATRLDGGAGLTPGGEQLFLDALPPAGHEGSRPEAPVALGGVAQAPLGAPSLAADGEGGGEGSVRLAWTGPGSVSLFGVRPGGTPTALPSPSGPAPLPGGEALAGVGGAGGGLLAWPAALAAGGQALALQEQFPSGELQSALLSGTEGGPVSGPRIGRAEDGEALLAFLQGEPGRLEILADRVTAPPAGLVVRAPRHWVGPRRARLSWQAPRSGVGAISYSVLLDGQVAASGLRRRRFTPPGALLGNGVTRVEVLASDGDGGQVLSPPVRLRVDTEAPRLRLRLHGRRAVVLLRDGESGLERRATRCRFGDGTTEHGGGRCTHVYARPGRYTISVRDRDRVGNAEARVLRVRVR